MTRIPQPSRDAQASEWTVYADALQEANDPRGELIALNLAVAKGMAPADRDAYVAKHKAALLGPAAEHFDAVRVTWIGCIAEAVELRVKASDSAERIVTAYLGSPLAAARSLALVGVPEGGTAIDLSAAVELLTARWPADCRSLALVDDRAAHTTMLASRDYDPSTNLVTFGSLGAIWKHVEDVRIVVADSHQLDLGAIDAPQLQAFTLHSLRYASAYNGDAPLSPVLGNAKWPKLKSFELRLPEEYAANIIADEDAYVPQYHGDEDYEDRADEAEDGENMEGANWSQLAPLLANLATRPLERLALTSFDTTGSLLDALAAAGLAKTLVELDLSDSSIASPDWFLEHAAMFHSVKRLVLERTPMSDDDAKKLAGLGPEIVHSHGAGATYRYVVGSE